MNKTVEKKILPEFFKEVRTHRKTFEIRKDEDDIQPGDILLLREWDGEQYTGAKTKREVTYVLRDAEEYGLMEGYCCVGIHPIGWDYIHQTTVIQNGDNCNCIENVGTLIL